ncbi:UNVERIFIED_CONTAM: hypothetical protein ITH36_24210 [Salmonella enterica subsp. enterica serovar Weltevreden]
MCLLLKQGELWKFGLIPSSVKERKIEKKRCQEKEKNKGTNERKVKSKKVFGSSKRKRVLS